MRARKLIKNAVAELKASEAIDHWQKGRERIEAEELLAFVMGGEEPEPDDKIGEGERAEYLRLIARRATGEPIPYIKGYTEFRGLKLKSEPGRVRPARFVRSTSPSRRSSGCVAADRRSSWTSRPVPARSRCPSRTTCRRPTVYGTDLSEDAVKLARRNARRLRLKVRFAAGDVFGGLPKTIAGSVDVITVHPPVRRDGRGRRPAR